MNRRLFGLAAAVLALGAAACVSDPTDTLSGEVDKIVTSRSRVVLSLGDSALVTAELIDRQGATLPGRPEAITTSGGNATVSDASVPPLPITSFYVKGVTPGPGTVTVSAGSVSATITVLVLPPTFDGTVSVVSTATLDTIVIAAGTLIGFDDAASTALVDGESTILASRSATELKIIARVADAADVSLTLENVLFLPGTDDELAVDEIDFADPVTLTGEDNEPGNDDEATATAVALGGAADGVLTESDIDDYFVLTLAAPTALDIIVDFEGGGTAPDIDVFLLNATGGGFCTLDNNCAMATGSNPETTTTAVIPAGTYKVLVELFDLGGAAAPVWYRLAVRPAP
jgi:hypothetical protein